MTDRERLEEIEECYRPTVTTHHHYLLGGIPVEDVRWLIETLKKDMDIIDDAETIFMGIRANLLACEPINEYIKSSIELCTYFLKKYMQE